MSPKLLEAITTIQLSLFSNKGPADHFETLLELENAGHNVQEYLENMGKGEILEKYLRYADRFKEIFREKAETLGILQVEMIRASHGNPFFRLFEIRARFLISEVMSDEETNLLLQNFRKERDVILQEENLENDAENNGHLAEVDNFIFRIYFLVEKRKLLGPSQRMMKRRFA